MHTRQHEDGHERGDAHGWPEDAREEDERDARRSSYADQMGTPDSLRPFLPPPRSTLSKVALGLLAFATLPEAMGVITLVENRHASGMGAYGGGILGFGFGAAAAGLCVLGAIVASARLWRGQGEGAAALACLAGAFLSPFLLLGAA